LADSKYRPELCDVARAVLTECGQHKAVYSAIGIQKSTYQTWLADPAKSAFAAAVSDGLERYKAQGWPELRNLAQLAIKSHLESVGRLAVTTTVKVVKRAGERDGFEEETTQTVTQPVKADAQIIKLALDGGWASNQAYLAAQKYIAQDGFEAGTEGEIDDKQSVAERIKAGLGLK
jgi:hypothetical protein